MQAKQRNSNYPSPPLRRIGGPFRGRRASHTDVPLMKHALSEAALPLGFRFAATACGLKKTGALDLAILSSDVPASAAARFRRPSARSFAETSLAICTTDTRPKTAAASFKMAGKRIHFVGCAKGAGMIHPNMATMLAFVATDAAIAPSLLQKTLRDVTGRTFNAISVDGDTSTNDTLLVLANGEAGAPSIKANTSAHCAFTTALEEVCRSLALVSVAG